MLRAIPFLPPFWSKSGTIMLHGDDPDGDPLSYELIDGPVHGELKGTPPSLTYVPKACYAGTDRLTFRVRDGKLDSEVATVDIHVGEDCNGNGVADRSTSPREQARTATVTECPTNATSRSKGAGLRISLRGRPMIRVRMGSAGILMDMRAEHLMAVMCISRRTSTALGYSGEILRYDTKAEFGTSGAWATMTCRRKRFGSTARGFSGAMFDGRYVYFVPAISPEQRGGPL